MTPLELRTDIAERAAILEYDNGMSRANAEAQAVREIYDRLMADGRIRLSGVLAGLIRAARQRYHPSIAPEVEAQGLDHARVAWGFDWVVPDGETYRPADGGEAARAAVILPAIEDGGIVDLVAQGLNSGSLLTRLGAASVIGADEIERARSTEQPLYIFASPLAWLRGGGRGAVVVDWRNVGRELEGVQTIICSESIAARLHAGTRKCFPLPAITIPSVWEARLAA